MKTEEKIAKLEKDLAALKAEVTTDQSKAYVLDLLLDFVERVRKATNVEALQTQEGPRHYYGYSQPFVTENAGMSRWMAQPWISRKSDEPRNAPAR